MDDGLRRDDIILHLRRDHVFEDSFRELYRRPPEDLKGNLYIQFEGEEGQDAGGLLREWYLIIAREMFDPNYALFRTTPGDKVTYMPNPSSNVNPNHLNYFKFIGRVIAKAIYDNKLLDCYFTRSFYKHILGTVTADQLLLIDPHHCAPYAYSIPPLQQHVQCAHLGLVTAVFLVR